MGVQKTDNVTQNEKPTNIFKKISNLLGPTFIAISLTIGGGTVTTVTSMAAQTGYKFLWSLIPQVFCLFIILMMCNRITLVTGQGVISGIRTYLNKYVAWIFAGVVLFGTIVFHAPQYTLASSVFSSIVGGNGRVWAIGVYLMVLFILINPLKYKNHMKLIEFFLRVCVFGLILAFAMVLFFIDIEWGEVAGGLVPLIPSNQNEWFLFAGIMGAALTINVPVLAAYVVKQLKWNESNIKSNNKESLFSNFLFLIVQSLIIITIGATLFTAGVVPSSGLEGALALSSFTGSWGGILFSIGLLGAVISTIITQLLVCGYVITDLFNWDQDVNSKKFIMIQIVIATLGTSGPLIGWNAVTAMTAAGAINLTFMPIGLLIWWTIGNKKSVMNQYRFNSLENIGITIAVLLSIMATITFWINFIR